MEEDKLETYNNIIKKVFSEDKGKIFIGGEEINSEMLRVLKDQAFAFRTTQLYETLRATILNEAYDIALIQSGKSGSIENDVQYAKAMKHFMFVVDNILDKLKTK